MAVKLRLTRMGNTNRPFFRVVAADSRARRDGPHIAILGHYDPTEDPARLELKEEQLLHWLEVGAQPTDTVRSLLRQKGIWQKFQAQCQAAKAAKARRAPAKGAGVDATAAKAAPAEVEAEMTSPPADSAAEELA